MSVPSHIKETSQAHQVKPKRTSGQDSGKIDVSSLPIWKIKNIRLPTKLKLFTSNVISTLLYGSETWRHSKALDEKLKVFVNTCLRQILQIRWPETSPTKTYGEQQESIKKMKWQWIGHTP